VCLSVCERRLNTSQLIFCYRMLEITMAVDEVQRKQKKNGMQD
jgi:hypothetical protein